MGLTPPLLYVDANVLIYSVERTDALGLRAQAALSVAATLVTSELSRMECTILPLRQANATDLQRYEDLFDDIPTFPIARDVLRRAAQLRADHRFLKTPDALLAATALEHGCAEFVTHDPVLAKVPGLMARAI